MSDDIEVNDAEVGAMDEPCEATRAQVTEWVEDAKRAGWDDGWSAGLRRGKGLGTNTIVREEAPVWRDIALAVTLGVGSPLAIGFAFWIGQW